MAAFASAPARPPKQGAAECGKYIIVSSRAVRPAMPDPADKKPQAGAAGNAPCAHPRARVIAKDEDAEYLECLICGELFEAGEQPPATGAQGSVDGSLSDA
ncbi:MAG TPA: hypothetical protein VLV89_10940 [Candidatus Acidoferrum sp.]|nr:hypothetical protein [Candidatus Acidoferrum sp.]